MTESTWHWIDTALRGAALGLFIYHPAAAATLWSVGTAVHASHTGYEVFADSYSAGQFAPLASGVPGVRFYA